jgi:hypothetical protein
MAEGWFHDSQVVAARAAMIEAQDAWRGVAPIGELAEDQLSDVQRERLAAARKAEKNYVALRDAAMSRSEPNG